MALNPAVIVDQRVVARPDFSFVDWCRVLLGVVRGISDKNLSMISAGIAFFASLALFPAITAMISLYGYVSDPLIVQDNLTMLAPFLPEQVYTLVDDRVTELVTARRSTLGLASLISLLLALWSAQAGISSMISGLNAIMHETQDRNFFVNLLVSYLLTLLLILGTILALVAVVILPVVMAFIPFDTLVVTFINIARWVIALLSLTLAIGALYRFGPNRRYRLPVYTFGTLVATGLWIGVSTSFSIYLSNFSNYDEIYGALGTVVVLLMWFYLSAFAVLIGAELNAAIEEYAVGIIRKRASQGQDDVGPAT